MIDDIHFGELPVSIGGYEIITPQNIFFQRTGSPFRTLTGTTEIAPEPSIVAIEGKDGDVRSYEPLENKSLFKIFSNLTVDDNKIIDFANEYGLLGEKLSTKRSFGEHEPVEPLSFWKYHINRMSHAVELWEHIQKKDKKWLSKHIKWVGDKNQPITNAKIIFRGTANSKSAIIASKGYEETFLKQCTFEETYRPARFYLQKLVNNELVDRVTNKLLFKNDCSGSYNVITANNLIGFMWLQLSLSIEGDLKYRKCVVCKKTFRLDHRNRGKPRRFCSDACKSKDYRNKKKAKNHE